MISRFNILLCALLLGIPSIVRAQSKRSTNEVPPMILVRNPSSVMTLPSGYLVKYPSGKSEHWFRTPSGYTTGQESFNRIPSGYIGRNQRFHEVPSGWRYQSNNVGLYITSNMTGYTVGKTHYFKSPGGLHR